MGTRSLPSGTRLPAGFYGFLPVDGGYPAGSWRARGWPITWPPHGLSASLPASLAASSAPWPRLLGGNYWVWFYF